MVSKRIPFFLIVGILCVFSFTLLPSNKIEKAQWLIGTWENKTSRGSVFETWKKISDLELLGMSYAIQQNDTVLFEEILLIQENDSVFYIPTVKNQNDGLPIQFAMISMTDSSMLFKQPYHDFPQVIQYKKINSDSLKATISGIQNGQFKSLDFPMRKIR